MSTSMGDNEPSTAYTMEELVPDEPIDDINGSSRRKKTTSAFQMSVEGTSTANLLSPSSAGAATEIGKGPTNSVKVLWKTLTQGGTVFDGFLLAASQEVGQSILTLPNVFSQLGFSAGVFFELFFATMALYTNFLLVSMHAQYRHKLAMENDPRHNDKYYIASYHEIMESLVGPKMKVFSLGVVFFALLGLTTVQIIATSSNFYILAPGISKRSWSIVWGGIFSLMAFVPTFRHYRALSVFGILTTTYTAWYMTVASLVEGPDDDVVYDAPPDIESFFQGLVQLLFIYGGHTSNIEVADVMDDPAAYDKSYFWSYLYVFTLTMPNAVAAYHTYGAVCRDNANAFALFPQSLYRDFGIVMMTIHQCVAFGLFAGPLFHMWEKLIGVSHYPFRYRSLFRVPLVMTMVVIAVAFPFFGVVNSILGAFTTSFGTYIIPTVAYNFAFPSSEDEHGMVKKPPQWIGGLRTVRMINFAIAVFVLLAGVGAGGYFSIKKFIEKVEEFEYFAECYQC